MEMERCWVLKDLSSLLAAAYHPADDANADAKQDVAGEDIDDDHALTHEVSRLKIHEPEGRRDIDGIIDGRPEGNPARDGPRIHRLKPLQLEKELIQHAE